MKNLEDALFEAELARLARMRYGADDPADLPQIVQEELEAEAVEAVEDLLETEYAHDLESRLARERPA